MGNGANDGETLPGNRNLREGSTVGEEGELGPVQLRDRFLSHVPRREADWDAGKRKAPDFAGLVHTRGKHENAGREMRTAHVEEGRLHRSLSCFRFKASRYCYWHGSKDDDSATSSRARSAR